MFEAEASKLFSVKVLKKLEIVNTVGVVGPVVFVKVLNSATVTRKQPRACQQMGMAAFQTFFFIYKNRWLPNLVPLAKAYTLWFWNPLIFLLPRGKVTTNTQG